MSPLLSPFKKSPFNSPVIAKLRCWTARLRQDKCETLVPEECISDEPPYISTPVSSAASPGSDLGYSSVTSSFSVTPSQAIPVDPSISVTPFLDICSVTTTYTQVSTDNSSGSAANVQNGSDCCLRLTDLDSPGCWATSFGDNCEPSHSLGKSSTYQNAFSLSHYNYVSARPSSSTEFNSSQNTSHFGNNMYDVCPPSSLPSGHQVFYYTPFAKLSPVIIFLSLKI